MVLNGIEVNKGLRCTHTCDDTTVISCTNRPTLDGFLDPYCIIIALIQFTLFSGFLIRKCVPLIAMARVLPHIYF